MMNAVHQFEIFYSLPVYEDRQTKRKGNYEQYAC